MLKSTRIVFNAIVLVFFSLLISRAQYPDWQAITGMNNIRDVTGSDNTLWAVSDGGAFSFNLNNDQLKRFTTVDGLKSVDLQSVVADNHAQILTASSNGYIQAFDLASAVWTTVYKFDGFSINDLFVNDDTLWVATEKGIAHFFWRNGAYQFNDLFQNFPEQIDNILQLALFDNKIWAATPQGLLFAPSDVFKYTLNDPGRWGMIKGADGLPATAVNCVTADSLLLWIGTSQGMASLDKIGNITPAPAFLSKNISNIQIVAPLLYVASGRGVFKFNPQSGIEKTIVFDKTVKSITYNSDLWAGLSNAGLKSFEGQRSIKVNGPPFSNLRYVWLDYQQRIWLSSGKYKLHSPVEGFYIFDQSQWKQYKFKDNVWGRLSASVVFYEDRNDNMWIGSWGGGLAVYNKQKDTFEFMHNSASSGSVTISTPDTNFTQTLSLDAAYKNHFSGANNGVDDYEVITAFREDTDGNLWFVNSYAKNGRYLAVAPLKANGIVDLDVSKWTYFGKSDGIILSEGGIADLAFDDFGRVWLATENQGVYILDYNRTLNNKSDDVVFLRDTDDNLAGNEVRALANDNDGVIWIGTTSGLSSFDGLNFYRHPGDGENGVNGPVGIRINQIRVDAANNKWLATSGGMSILRSNKSVFEPGAWESFTTANSGLLNNNVHSIYIDQVQGKAYIATEGGLSVYTGSFADLRENFNSVIAGPNPFILDGTNNRFQIRHLKGNSTVKIYTIFGKLIRVISATNNDIDGGRAYWDGQDTNGFPVASGVYLYIAYSDDGASTTGKVAVIRK